MKYILVVKSIVNISHLEILFSYAYYLCSKAEKVSLYISLSESIWDKKILSRDDFEKYDLPINLEIVSEDMDAYSLSDTVYICNFGYIGVRNWLDSKKYKNFQGFIQFDEGSGSWQSFFTLLMIGLEEQRNKNKPSISYLLKKVTSKLIGMTQRSKVYQWTWLKKGNVNTDIIKYLPTVYASKKYKQEIPFFRNETWIILTGGFVESGYVSSEAYVDWLAQVIMKVKTNDNNILLKCHPAEDISKYDSLSSEVQILEISDSIDSLLWKKKYHSYKVIGEYSTALITLSLLYDIPTYFVKSLVSREISGDFRKLFEKHVKELKMSKY